MSGSPTVVIVVGRNLAVDAARVVNDSVRAAYRGVHIACPEPSTLVQFVQLEQHIRLVSDIASASHAGGRWFDPAGTTTGYLPSSDIQLRHLIWVDRGGAEPLGPLQGHKFVGGDGELAERSMEAGAADRGGVHQRIRTESVVAVVHSRAR